MDYEENALAEHLDVLYDRLRAFDKGYVSLFDRMDIYESLPDRNALFGYMKQIDVYPRYKARLLDIINLLRRALRRGHFSGDILHNERIVRNIEELVSEFCTYYDLDPNTENDLSYIQHSAPQQVVKEVQDTKTIAELLRQIQKLQEENRRMAETIIIQQNQKNNNPTSQIGTMDAEAKRQRAIECMENHIRRKIAEREKNPKITTYRQIVAPYVAAVKIGLVPNCMNDKSFNEKYGSKISQSHWSGLKLKPIDNCILSDDETEAYEKEFQQLMKM